MQVGDDDRLEFAVFIQREKGPELIVCDEFFLQEWIVVIDPDPGMVDIIFEIHLCIGEDFPIRAEDFTEHKFMPVDTCRLHGGKRPGPDLPFIFESVPELHRRKIALSTGIEEKQEKD